MTKDYAMGELRMIWRVLKHLPDDADIINIDVSEAADCAGRSTVLVYDDVADLFWPAPCETEVYSEHGELHRTNYFGVAVESWVHDDGPEDDDDENPYDWGSWHDDIDDLWEEW